MALSTAGWMAALHGGWLALEKYFFGKIFGAFIPAFFLAGAIGTWIPKSAVIRYLSPKASKKVAYLVATIAGGLLSVCACGILPLFSAIYSRGAGIGPAITFLFAGPAINLIAIFYTYDLLGSRLGHARIVAAFGLSVLIGLAFSALFEERAPPQEAPARKAAIDLSAGPTRTGWQTAAPMLGMVLATVVLPLDVGRFFPFLKGSELSAKLGVVALSIAFVVATTKAWFSAEERSAWLEKTRFLLMQILPKVLIGIFLTGMLESTVQKATILEYVGQNDLASCGVASLVGGVLYFGTILGVIAARFFQVMGMPDGPVLALLLAGPAVTLPSVLAITEIIGKKRALAYFTLVVLFSTLAGFALTLI